MTSRFHDSSFCIDYLGNYHRRPYLFSLSRQIVLLGKLILLWQLYSKIDFFHIPQNSAGSEPEASAGKLARLCIYHLFQNRRLRLSQRQCHMLGINKVSALPRPSTTYMAPVPCAGCSTCPPSCLSVKQFLLLSSVVRAYL